MTDIPIAEAEADVAAVIARVEAGEDVRLLRDGQPVVRLTAIRHRPATCEPPFDFAEFEAITKGKLITDEVVSKMRDDARY